MNFYDCAYTLADDFETLLATVYEGLECEADNGNKELCKQLAVCARVLEEIRGEFQNLKDF